MPRKNIDTTNNENLDRTLFKINENFKELYSAPSAPGTNFSDLEVATADAEDDDNGVTAAALANDLKAKFNDLIARLSGE